MKRDTYTYLLMSLFLLGLGAPLAVDAKEPPNQPVMIRIHDTQGKTQKEFHPFGKGYFGRASMTSADITGDGIDEIIVGAGARHDPIVKIFNQEGIELHAFTAYHPSFQLGVHVAACDLDGDGKAEVITGTMHGGGPHVRIFNPTTGYLWNDTEFFAYENSFRGGVHVACGNVDADNDIEIITGPGITGGPHLKVFSTKGELKQEQFVGAMPSNSGLQITVSNMDHTGPDEIIATEQQDGTHYLFVLGHNTQTRTLQVTHHALLGENKDNVSISTFDFGSGAKDILVSSGYDKTSTSIFTLDGKERAAFAPFTTVGHGSQTTHIHTSEGKVQMSMNDSGNHRFHVGKYILVDISDQRLYAFDSAVLHNTFLISSGLPQYETPRGTFEVMAKLPTHTYRWSFGAGDARNYEIPNVKWNLRFLRHYYIHSATWHNNFGKKMSHGCINVRQDDAEKLFAWTDVKTIVEVTD